MKQEDIKYLCQNVGNLTGIPVRYYSNGKLCFQISTVSFPKDPIELHIDKLKQTTAPIEYYLTEEFLYYGIINTQKAKIIIGPSSEIPLSKSIVRQLAFSLELYGHEKEAFEQAIQSLNIMPIHTLLQIMCSLYFGLTGEKKTLKDLTIMDESQSELKKETEKQLLTQKEYQSSNETVHNTYSIEQTLLDFIRNGNVSGLLEWTKSTPSVRTGILAPNQIRQIKNTFIVSATLASRAAIEGGLNIEDSLTLSDLYIRKCEALDSIDRITNLQYHMILDFTTQVQSLRFGDAPSALVLKVANYVRQHISDTITTEKIAEALFLSRGYLSTTFKKKTGMSLSNYITSIKIEEAKRLLLSTDKSMSQISAYLGFSSQSHFSSVFQKYEGQTPSNYRSV